MHSFQRTFSFLHRHPIAKRHKLFAYYRFFTWQLRSRLLKNKLHVIPFINPTRFLAKRQLTGITGSIYTGLQDFEEMSFLLHFLRKEDCFFDVGSNVGAYTILAAGVKGCSSVAFEPNCITFQLLKKNIDLNGLSSLVACENKGVGSAAGQLKFTVDGDTTNHVISQDEELLPFTEVPITSLDAYADEYSPAVMKIDVEGFETEVIKGARKMLSQNKLKAIMIELNGSGGRYGFDESKIHEKLCELSFAPYTYDAFSRTLKKQKSFGDFNTLYIRDEDYVLNRLKMSEPFRVWNTVV